jgi:hypothetical protein
MKNLSFKLKTKAWPVTLENEKGEELKYEIRELKSAKRDKYVDQLTSRLITDKSGNVIGMKKYEGMQAELLIICMWSIPEEGEPKLVDKATLDGWPGTTVQDLFRAAQVVNGFRKAEERNQIVAEELMKWLSTKETGDAFQVTVEEIEAVIEETEKNLLSDAKEEPETETVG